MKKNYSLKALKKIIVRQQDQSDCGVAALQTVIQWHGGIAFSEDIRIGTGTNINGTSMLGLYQAASEFGLDAEGYEMDVEHLLKQEEPCILHLLLDGQRLHYMVYLGYSTSKEEIILGDPAEGLKLLSPDELIKLWASKSALTMTPNNNFRQAEKSLAKEKRTWFIDNLREDVPLLGISVLLGFFIAVIGLSTAIFSQKLIDQFLPDRNSQYIVVGLVLLFVVLLSRSLLSYLRQHVMLRQGQAYNERLTGYFIDKILRLPKIFYDSRKSGDMIARLNDTQRIQRNINYMVGNVVVDLLISIVSLVAVFVYSLPVGLLTLIFIPIIILLIYSYTERFVFGQKEVMTAYAHTESYYINTLNAISAIKENHAHAFFADIGKNVFSLYQKAVFKLGQYGNQLTAKVDVLASFITVAVISMCVYLYYQDKMTVGTIIAIISLVSSILPAVVRLAQINLQIQEIKVAFNRMYDLTNTREEVIDEEQRELSFDSLCLQNVGFRFKGQQQLLEKVNLEVNKGELVGIVGYSGAGKSTLLQLIQGLYGIDSGCTSVNGHTQDLTKTLAWRSIYATVPQDIKLFNGNVYSNVVMDKPCSIEEFRIFCENYGFHQFFIQWPMGYQTPLGDDGVRLSGGQRQILALARALYKKPQLLLLDEATSALDATTESFILALLQKLKTEHCISILFITHRGIISEIADRLYLLENRTVQLYEKNEKNELNL
ncbi:ABC transporter transmembrane domain-containing protein [Sphingobacterium sp. UT-1RO-CII-1]|uniref:peptidase domain-containing ABC transporter n=1 Tax=Sphingobacterium sp. UT-1RO-CII-1 TaxID=2995225 RepID=UPI00227D6F38|nr:ABC transporter transmembrane domain-containing protein [Sphingobacterium sp. UT-1RO-CII-1]MCY4779865.1 ABC transporter transmembrane domain-containing protein [Sphingobacterium sp. UT-1RO-CII-1]